MPVLPHLGDEQFGFAPHAALDRLHPVEHLLPAAVAFVGRGVDALNRGRLSAVTVEAFLHRRRDFTERRAGAGGFDRKREQVVLDTRRLRRTVAECPERRRTCRFITRRLDAVDPRDLPFAHLGVIDLERFEQIFVLQAIFVHPDDHIVAAVDARLSRGGGGFDHRLGPAGRHGLCHAAFIFDAFDDLPCLVDQFLRQRLDIIGTAERVDDLGHPGLFLDDDLGVARDAGGEVGRQRDRFIERVGMQRLGAAEHRRHRLDRRAHDIVVRVLLGERDP